MTDLKKAARDMAEIGNTYLDLEWAKLECPELANRYWATKKKRTRKKVLQQIRERKTHEATIYGRFPTALELRYLNGGLQDRVMRAMGWEPALPLVEPIELPEQVRDVEKFQIEGSFPIRAYFEFGKEVEEQTKKAMVLKIGPDLEEKGLLSWKEREAWGYHYVIRAELQVVRP